ncbi:MAG: hypothetical protein HC893_15715 [Chloroflexaceae bacterium]|nr:hypothetical protein [Chloroflexaceae bacterium]
MLVETLQSDPPAPVRRRMLGQISHEVDAVTQLAEELHELSQIESGRVTIQLAPTSIGPVIERALNRIRPQAERKNILVQAIIIDNQLPVLIDNRRIDQVLLNLLHNAVKFTSDGGQITVRTQTLYVDETAPGKLNLLYHTTIHQPLRLNCPTCPASRRDYQLSIRRGCGC